MGNIFCSTCCTDGKPEPKFGEFLKPARFSGAVPTRYVVLNEGKIEYFERKGKGNDPLKGEDMKGFINLYEFVLQKNPLNPLMLTFGRSSNKHVKSNLPDIMPPSTRMDNYEFQCKSEEERAKWARAIQEHAEYCKRTFYSM